MTKSVRTCVFANIGGEIVPIHGIGPAGGVSIVMPDSMSIDEAFRKVREIENALRAQAAADAKKSVK